VQPCPILTLPPSRSFDDDPELGLDEPVRLKPTAGDGAVHDTEGGGLEDTSPSAATATPGLLHLATTVAVDTPTHHHLREDDPEVTRTVPGERTVRNTLFTKMVGSGASPHTPFHADNADSDGLSIHDSDSDAKSVDSGTCRALLRSTAHTAT